LAAQAEQQMRVRHVWSDYGIVLSGPIGRPLTPWSESANFRRLTGEPELPRTRFHDLGLEAPGGAGGMLREIDN
jgi:hypothetical protein